MQLMYTPEEEQKGAFSKSPPCHHLHRPFLPESLVHGAIPADEGAGSEEEDPEDREPKA